MFNSVFALEIVTEIIVLAVAAVFFMYARRLSRGNKSNLNRYSAVTKGKVMRQWTKEMPLEKGGVSTTWYTDYSYSVDGVTYEKCSDVGSYRKLFEDGAEVVIRYVPDNPEEIYIPAENAGDMLSGRMFYILGGVTVGIAVLFVIVFKVVFG